MLANMLLHLGWGQKVKLFFLKEVIMHIKIKGMKLRTPCKQLFGPYILALKAHNVFFFLFHIKL